MRLRGFGAKFTQITPEGADSSSTATWRQPRAALPRRSCDFLGRALYGPDFFRGTRVAGGEHARVDPRVKNHVVRQPRRNAISTETTTVLVDPYVSRHRIRRLLTRTIRARTTRAIDRWIPKKVDAIPLRAQAHFRSPPRTAPRIAQRTGAKLVGFRDPRCRLRPRRHGVADASARGDPHLAADGWTVGDIGIRFGPEPSTDASRSVAFPFDGVVHPGPPRFAGTHVALQDGAARFGIVMNAAGACASTTTGGADLVDAELEGEARRRLGLVGLAGPPGDARFTSNASSHALSRRRSSCRPHHDAFFAPLEGRLSPRSQAWDIDGFIFGGAPEFAPPRSAFAFFRITGEEASVMDRLGEFFSARKTARRHARDRESSSVLIYFCFREMFRARRDVSSRRRKFGRFGRGRRTSCTSRNQNGLEKRAFFCGAWHVSFSCSAAAIAPRRYGALASTT